jgi:hypothetical protein
MRTYKRKNDIYEVQLADCKKYFQFIQTDSSLFGGDIIVIYSRKYDKSESPIIEDIVNGTIEYCCHTNVSRGIKEGLWRKYGNGPTYIDLSNIYLGITSMNRVSEYSAGTFGKQMKNLCVLIKFPSSMRTHILHIYFQLKAFIIKLHLENLLEKTYGKFPFHGHLSSRYKPGIFAGHHYV